MDNLNTHTPGSLYEAFEPSEARRLAGKLEIPSAPKHASWLNMAETELSVLSSQCLDLQQVSPRRSGHCDVPSTDLARQQDLASGLQERARNCGPRPARSVVRRCCPSTISMTWNSSTRIVRVSRRSPTTVAMK